MALGSLAEGSPVPTRPRYWRPESKAEDVTHVLEESRDVVG